MQKIFVQKYGYQDYELSTVVFGYRFHMRYMYYTRREAIKRFKERYKNLFN